MNKKSSIGKRVFHLIEIEAVLEMRYDRKYREVGYFVNSYAGVGADYFRVSREFARKLLRA